MILAPLIFGFLSTVDCQKDELSTSNPIIGAWEVIETTTIGAEDESRNPHKHPSIYIFQDGYYCMVMIQNNEPRIEFEDPWALSDEEIIKAYNSILVTA